MNELQIIKKLFPKSHYKISKLFNENINKASVVVKNDAKLQNYILQYTRNLNVNVGLVENSNLSAFTYPANFDGRELNTISNFLASFPYFQRLFEIYYVYYKLLSAKIDAHVDSNNIIIFTHKLPSDYIIRVYQTTSLLEFLKGDVKARFAIFLHEIGHWHSKHPYLVSSLVALFTPLIAFLTILATTSSYDSTGEKAKQAMFVIIGSLVISFMLISYINSINESNCDKFAAKLGYGDDKSRAFFKITFPKLKYDDPTKTKLLEYTKTFDFKITEFLSRIITGYPSIINRIAVDMKKPVTISEGILDLAFEVKIKDFFLDFDELFAKVF